MSETVTLNDGRTVKVAAAKAFHLRRAGLAPADEQADAGYRATLTPAQCDVLDGRTARVEGSQA
jgi:hypothetical protein